MMCRTDVNLHRPEPVICFEEQERKYELPNEILLEPIRSLE